MAAIYPFTSSILKTSNHIKNQNGNKFSKLNCINHEIKNIPCQSNALFGSNKPVYEGMCNEDCSNLWNNSTKRKSVVYKNDNRTNIVSGLGNIGFEDRILNNSGNFKINSKNNNYITKYIN